MGRTWGLLAAIGLFCGQAAAGQPRVTALDGLVAEGMQATGSQGLAIAIIEDGKVTLVKTWGRRNGTGAPLTPDTVMYGASLTKMMFGYLVAQLADEGALDLDASIATMLPRPLPAYTGERERYAPYEDLAGDPRWRRLTPRMLLNHTSGFANFHGSKKTGI